MIVTAAVSIYFKNFVFIKHDRLCTVISISSLNPQYINTCVKIHSIEYYLNMMYLCTKVLLEALNKD